MVLAAVDTAVAAEDTVVVVDTVVVGTAVVVVDTAGIEAAAYTYSEVFVKENQKCWHSLV